MKWDFVKEAQLFEPKSFTEMDEALNYLLKRIDESYYPASRDVSLDTLPKGNKPV